MTLELERVWLVNNMPTDLEQYDFTVISQHYLNLQNGGRLRRQCPFRRIASGQHAELPISYVLTQKRSLKQGDKKRREENNIILNREAYDLLKSMALRGLKKNRYLIPLGDGLTAELDVFQDELRGLVWVEVEFPSETAMDAFTPPAWFGREVTEESWASSSWVAGRTFKEIKCLITA